MSAKPDPDLELACDIFELVKEIGDKKSGVPRQLALAASISLGDAFMAKAKVVVEVDNACAKQREHYEKAVSYYDLAMDQQSEVYHSNRYYQLTNGAMPQLGSYHPTTLHARQASVVARILVRGDAEPDYKDIQGYKQELEIILMLQKTRPGGSHPQRLKAMVAVLALQLALGDPKERVLQTLEELVRRLKKGNIRKQRFFESLSLEVNVAEILKDVPELSKEYDAVLKSIEEAIQEAGVIEDLSLRNGVKNIKDRLSVDTNIPE